MELPGIPDAKEPDGPEDGVVVLENNLGAAIEVTLDQEVKMLYPGKSWIFGITGASDKLMKVHCRDDPSILGTRQVEDGLAHRASESFGSFGVQVADFLQKEQEEVEREKSLLQERKKRMEEELVKERRREAFCRFPMFFSCTALLLGLLVLMACMDPEDHEDSAIFLCFFLVLGLASLCGYSSTALTAGLRFSGPRRKVLVYYGSYCSFFLGSLIVTIAIVRSVMAGFWWTVLAAGLPCCGMSTFMCVELLRRSSEEMIKDVERFDKEVVANRTIAFEGKVRPGTGKCVLMARQIRVCLGRPGHRQPQWQHQCSGGLSPRGFNAFRPPRHNSRRGKATRHVLVRSTLWGAEAVGLRLVDTVDCKHRKSAQRRRGNGSVLLQRHEG